MNNANISNRLFDGSELDNIKTIIDSSDSDIDKMEQIKTQFISLILRHAKVAHDVLRIKPSSPQVCEYVDGILSATGRLLDADLDMFKHYGADFKALICILNDDISAISAIQQNGDMALSFGELIIKYNLGVNKYPEIRVALIKAKTEGDQ